MSAVSAAVSAAATAAKRSVFDFAIVGSGIVGLATALELSARRPTAKLVVIDKERQCAQHQSTRNSGVIHAGIYYKPGSLRASLCVEGAERMYSFLRANAIEHRKCGKVIVAVQTNELERLDALEQRAHANGCAVERWSAAQVRQREPLLERAVEGLFSPNSGITDYALVCRAMEAQLRARGCQFLYNFHVDRASFDARRGAWQLSSAQSATTRESSVDVEFVVGCAGLHADTLAQQMGGALNPQIVPVRGEWRYLAAPWAKQVRSLIYPVPDPAFPWLGVHFTRRIDDSVLVGPNAILGTAKEGYRVSDVNARELWAMARHSGVRNLVLRELRYGIGEFSRSISRRLHIGELRGYVPRLRAADLSVKKRAGVRALAIDADGALVDDFVFESGAQQCLHVRNAPSPGATASLAIAEKIVQRCLRAH